MRWKDLFVSVVWLLFAAVCQANTVSIFHIDVDQGDATLVVSSAGRTLLIDGGDTGKGIGRVVPLLNALRISSLDYTLATHYDADHIGGLDEVIRTLGGGVNIQAFDRGDADKTTIAYKDYLAAAGAKRKEIKPGERIDMGDPALEVICVAANQKVQGGRAVEPVTDDENGNSVALRIRFHDFDYFIGGDLTGGGKSGNRKTPDVERLVAAAVGDVDVLKISHHGSQTSSSLMFVRATRPEVAVISVGDRGKNLRFHHPHRQVLNHLRDTLTLREIFLTHRGETTGGLTREELERMKIAGGNVIVITDGRTYTVNGSVFPTDGANP